MLTERRVVPFNALAPGVMALRHELDAALDRVLRRGWFLQGPETEAFEQAFAAYHDGSGSHGMSGGGGRGGALRAVGVGSGTDALRIALQALGVAPGDEVLVVANAGVPPVAAVVAAGARPVFCDVAPDTHTLDPSEIARRASPRTAAVLVVHLYGRMAAMDAILAAARARGLAVLEDCAQAHGARDRGRLAGTLGDAAAFSFYPTKNLGALGDGGAILARDPAVVERARRLRVYGWPPGTKYVSQEHGTVSRLDELQAAVLGVKLPHLESWNVRRRQLAALYRVALADVAGIELPTDPTQATGPARLARSPRSSRASDPSAPSGSPGSSGTSGPAGSSDPAGPGSQHVYHLFVARILAGQAARDALRARLAAHGIGTDVHYPLPAHLQAPYRPYGQGEGSLPHTERLAREVLSLPLYPQLAEEDVRYVAEQLRASLDALGHAPAQPPTPQPLTPQPLTPHPSPLTPNSGPHLRLPYLTSSPSPPPGPWPPTPDPRPPIPDH